MGNTNGKSYDSVNDVEQQPFDHLRDLSRYDNFDLWLQTQKPNILSEDGFWMKVYPLLKQYSQHKCDEKILYLFKSKKQQRQGNIANATKTIEIPDCCDIYPCYPFGFPNLHILFTDRIPRYTLLNGKHIFKCEKKNQFPFIRGVNEILYNDDDCGVNTIYKWKTYEYKFHNIYHWATTCNINKKEYNAQSKTWLQIPITVIETKSKFLLCIKRNESASQILNGKNNDDLRYIISDILKKYYNTEKKKFLQFIAKDMKIHAKSSSVEIGKLWNAGFDWVKRIPDLKGIGSVAPTVNEDDQKAANAPNNNNPSWTGQSCKDGFNCQIYKRVKDNHEYSQSNYKHLYDYNHFSFDYDNKPQCRFGINCKAFIRLSRMNENKDNYDCHRLDDLCHVTIYKHPPRLYRSAKMQYNNMNQFQTAYEIKSDGTAWGGVDGMIPEIIKNGCEKDLCLTSDDLKNKRYSLLRIANQKLQSKIHKIKYMSSLVTSEVLALLLYTQGESNYSMCETQRNGDYLTWQTLDILLFGAIETLSEIEDYSYFVNKTNGNFYLYSGLKNVQLQHKNQIDHCYLPTYISTSYKKNVSCQFANDNGMLMQFDKSIIKYHDKSDTSR